MEKVLKKYTSIPSHLYVERDADAQLKRIVDEMQRPGYVLVARQMGKTNLLFNAKRTLENENRLFVYVDLSNSFKYERECYLNIIDTIIEPNEDLFLNIQDSINELRQNKFPPHKEYSKSLRIILDHFQGNIVIVLDEIDALRTAEYSDNIFAQIRSNYFSRTNFEEFERLTYILSGVIEPTELIKDRNKSPFNIGDKIYLDDFTEEEHNTFIEKSKLKIDKYISQEIYKWTNGNPRLTFDICSEIEDFIINKGNFKIVSLKKLINEKYLTSFDISPIDHIRELVKSSKSTRKALINIQNGVNDLSDEMKKKLYLYGIINSHFNKKTKIKNKIIESSLSIDWLKSIEKSNQNITLTQGLAYFENKDYQEAIDIFSLLLSNDDNKEKDTLNYFCGLSYFHLKKYDFALNHLNIQFSDENEYKRKALSMRGVCKIATNNEDEGFKDLEKVIDTKTNDFAYHNALYNIAINSTNENSDKAIELFTLLYESLKPDSVVSDGRSEEEINNLKAVSLFHLAEINIFRNNQEGALDQLKTALNYASKTDSTFIKYLINSVSQTKDDEIFRTELIEDIINQKLEFANYSDYPISFKENHLSLYLSYLFNENNNHKFNELLDYSYKYLYKKKIKRPSIIYSISKNSGKKGELLNYLSKLDFDDDKLKSNLFRDISIINKKEYELFFESFNKYLTFTKGLSISDIYINSIALKLYFDNNRISEGISLCNELIPKIKSSNDSKLELEAVIIYYWLSNLYDKGKNTIDAKDSAKKTIEIIKHSKKGSTSMLDDKALKLVQDQMNEIINPIEFYDPYITKFNFGRNDVIKVKYKNGLTIKEKFKKLKNDIDSGKCLVIKTPNNA